MAEVKVKVDVDQLDGTESTGPTDQPVQAEMELKARKTLDGDFMIMDHEVIDIILSPKKQKITVFPKDNMGDLVYDAQNRLFHHLAKKGVIAPDTVQGGNYYGSLEGKLLMSAEEGVSTNQMAIFSIGKFLEDEAPYYMFQKTYDEDQDELLTDPDKESSTELGEVPHDDIKGSIVPGIRPYGLLYRIWEGKNR
jgi:hypothetical protein